jgi:hypothetical protein
VVEGRDSAGPSAWLARRGPLWLAEIAWVNLDLSVLTRPSSTPCCPTPSRSPTRYAEIPITGPMGMRGLCAWDLGRCWSVAVRVLRG